MTKPKSEKKSADQKAAEPAKKRGRRPDTAEAKAAKQAAKATEKAAGDKAEGAKRTAAAKVAAGDNSADPKLKQIFLDTLPKVIRLKDRIASVTGELRAVYKDAQRDGFTKDQFETAILCSDPEGEAKVQEKIAKALQAAQFVGAMLGKNLLNFEEPDRTPAADRAFEEGQRASMENKAALPPYAPETEQYRRYMDGFHSHQASLVTAGMKQINPPSPPPASEVTSGVAMTREAYRAQTAANAKLPNSGAENDDAAEGEEEEFADREAAS